MNAEVRIAVTGPAWLGRRAISVGTALEDMLHNAAEEVLVAAYTIGSGGEVLIAGLENAARRGVRIDVLLNRFTAQPAEVRDRLARLAWENPWCRILSFSPIDPDEDLHAKVIVVDRRSALVGSANFSRRGLLMNRELAVQVQGPAVEDIVRALESLINDRQLVRIVDTSSSEDAPPSTRWP